MHLQTISNERRNVIWIRHITHLLTITHWIRQSKERKKKEKNKKNN